MNKYKFLFVLCILPGLSQCATFFSKSKYTYYITSVPEKASVTIRSEYGRPSVTMLTPGPVQLDLRYNYVLYIHKQGYKRRTVKLKKELDPYFLAQTHSPGFFFYIVDWFTGAIFFPKDPVIQLHLQTTNHSP